MNGKTKAGIAPMIITAIVVTVVFALIGAGLCIWFSGAAKPMTRNIRNAVEWTIQFAAFYYIGCGISLLFTIVMTFMGAYANAYRLVNWVINTVVTVLIGVALAIVFYLITPSKYVPVSIVAAIAIFLQGLLIFFIASLFAPNTWGVYNPLKR